MSETEMGNSEGRGIYHRLNRQRVVLDVLDRKVRELSATIDGSIDGIREVIKRNPGKCSFIGVSAEVTHCTAREQLERIAGIERELAEIKRLAIANRDQCEKLGVY